jgi:hypothetical protein
VSGESVGKTAALGFGTLDRGSAGRFRGHWRHRALKTRFDRCISRRSDIYFRAAGSQNGNHRQKLGLITLKVSPRV